MRYQIPQFIEIEDKVVGPLTFKQFIYVAGGIGMSIVLYLYLPMLLAAPLIALVAALAGSLAFYKFNNKPFSDLIESALKYSISSRLYVWRKEQKKPKPKNVNENTGDAEGVYVPKLSESKLRDIAWSLDVHEDSIQQENINNNQQI